MSKSNSHSVDPSNLVRTLLVGMAALFSSVVSAEPVKVAFVGDQGVGENAQAVLSLIANEGTDLLLIQGDLGYSDNKAALWESNLDNALGADFPVLTVVGNHENYEWPIYQNLIQQRIDRVDSLSCTGKAGVKVACQFANIDIVQVAPGIREVDGVLPDADYAQFISSSFSDSNARWRICSWHKNQEAMQTGAKSNSTGWAVYDACLNAGAMIALAHEHAYSRTHLLSDFENQTIVHKSKDMTLKPGQSFAFVSGLGGWQVRPQLRGGDWWASIYTATQGATHGALFCSFADTTADCYFKAIDGAVPDQFSLTLATPSATDSASASVDNLIVEPVQENAAITEDSTVFLPASPEPLPPPEPVTVAETVTEPVAVPETVTEPVTVPETVTEPVTVPETVTEPERDVLVETSQANTNPDSIISQLENDTVLAAAEPLQEKIVGGGRFSGFLLTILLFVYGLRKNVPTYLRK